MSDWSPTSDRAGGSHPLEPRPVADEKTLENTAEIGCPLGEPALFRLGYNTL